MGKTEPRLGEHLILDVWGASRLDDPQYMETALRTMTTAAGATLIKTFMHHFGDNYGVSGVAILAESHISVHSWPERGYAAFDIFVCGNANAAQAIPIIEKLFSPTRIIATSLDRGTPAVESSNAL